MKKNLQNIIVSLLIIIFACNESMAQKKLIHYWDFNSANNPSNGGGGIQVSPYTADYSTLGNAKVIYGKVPGNILDTAIFDNYIASVSDVDTFNNRPGFGGCCQTPNYSVRARNPSDSMQLLWYIPTTHYKDIEIKYETEVSSLSKGQATQLFSYSTDSGATWKTTGLSELFDSAKVAVWRLVDINFNSDSSVNNNNRLVFRIKFRTHNTGITGNNRFDNFTVEGDTLIFVSGVSVYPKTMGIVVGDSGTVTATLSPTNPTNPAISWTSLNPSVATISQTGIVRGIATGTTKIYVKTSDGGFTDTCLVTVSSAPVAVTGVSVFPKILGVVMGDSSSVTATLSPINATNTAVTWTSLNSSIANVSQKGMVYGIALGTTKVYATTADGGFTDTCVVNVLPIAVTGVFVYPKTLGLVIGDSSIISAVVSPSDATNSDVTWTSLNPSVASVSQTGMVHGIVLGTTKVYVTTNDGNYTDTCTVTVTNPPVPSTRKLIHYWDFNSATIPPDGSGGVQVSPYTADYSTLGNAKVVYGKVPGTVLDTTSVLDNYISTDVDTFNNRPGFGGCCQTTNYSVRARNPSDSMQLLWYIPTTHYRNIEIKYETEVSSLSKGQATQLFTYSTDNGITWKTTGLSELFDTATIATWRLIDINFNSDSSVNNNSGLVFRIKFRTHNTGTTGNNRFDNFTVEGDTLIIVTGVSVYPKTMGIVVGNSSIVTATLSPTKPTNSAVSWTSSDTLIATVSQAGLVKGIALGTTKIYVKTADGGFTDTCLVTVTSAPVAVTGVSVFPKTLGVVMGDSSTVSSILSPVDATNIAVTWTSLNSSIASVIQTGMVHGIALGTTKVYVTTADGGFTDTCVVNVLPIGVTGVSVSPKTLGLVIGDSSIISAVVSPSNATNSDVTWTSLNPSVASVSQTGMVHGIVLGTTKVYVTTKDGSFTDTCTVTVINQPVPSTRRLIHYWDFNSATIPPNGNGGVQVSPYTADYSTLGNAKVVYEKIPGTSWDTSILDNYISTDVDTFNNRPGFGGCCQIPNYSVRARNPSDSMQLLWYIPTKHYRKLEIKYETEPSSLANGQATQLFSYSIDGGVTWLTDSLSQPSDSAIVKAWELISINFGADLRVNNNPNLIFRIKFRTNTMSTSGNNRFDNFTVEGDTDDLAVTGVSVSPKSIEILVGDSGTVSAELDPVDAANNAITWTSLNPSVATISQTGIVRGIAAGITKVYVKTVEGGFTDTCVVNVKIKTSLRKISNEEISVFPNPAKNQLQIKFDASSGLTKISVFSLIGVKVIYKEINNPDGNNTFIVPINDLAEGLYYISIQSGNKFITRSFVKKK
jgi:uncharacterized protein YjdB